MQKKGERTHLFLEYSMHGVHSLNSHAAISSHHTTQPYLSSLLFVNIIKLVCSKCNGYDKNNTYDGSEG